MALTKMIKDKKASDTIVIQRGDISGTLNDSLRRGLTAASYKNSAGSLDLVARNTLANTVAPSAVPEKQRFKFLNPEQNHFLFAWHPAQLLIQYGGGKAKNMATLTNLVSKVPGVRATVPAWFCVSTEAFKAFLIENHLDSQIAPHISTSEGLEAFHASLTQKIMAAPLSAAMTQELTALVQFLSANSTSSYNRQPYFAVRSSGADEDSVSHSFAGQFDSFLYRQTMDEIITALKKCWLSAFAPRVMSHRLTCGLPINNVRMGVVVQIMVDSECAGVAFSRHPLNPISANVSLVEAVWGQGEALVSGAAEPDSFEVERGLDGKVKETLVPKPKMWVRNTGGADGADATGLVAVDVPEPKASAAALTNSRARTVGATVAGLESLIGTPVDFEWAYQDSDPMLYCLQVRPIVNLPPASFFIATDSLRSEASSETVNDSRTSIESASSSTKVKEVKSKNKSSDLVDLSTIADRAMDALAAPQGMNITLWDNSNIVESYSGVTTPLTFSFASYNYRIVYETMLTFLGTPTKYIQENDDAFINLLGYIRGNVYYNLMNWYRLLLLAPLGKFSDPKHMETMMGVKQGQEGNADMEREFKKILDARPKFNAWHRTSLLLKYISAYRNIDRIVNNFFINFDAFYSTGREMNFANMSLEQISTYYKRNASTLLRDWKAPVINDLLVMGFFGTLKSFIAKHLVEQKAAPTVPGAAAPSAADAAAAAADAAAVDSLQNDLLCGEDVESAKPTKMLMDIAKSIDNTIEYRELGSWFSNHKDEILKAIKPEKNQWILRSTILKLSFVKARELLNGLNETEPGKPQPPVQVVADVLAMILEFLDSYGFRCINELKLEEKDLNDDPAFVIDAVSGYIRTRAYEVEDLDKREQMIRAAAEALVHQKLKGTQLMIFMWLLRNTRRVVKHRENLRFARSKVFGVMRRIFRGMGHQLVKLGDLENEQDVFYLTTEELLSYVDGRAVSRDLKALTKLRKTEFDGYVADSNAPPERFVTRGAAGVYMWYPHILADLDLLKDAEDSNGPPEPGILKGVSCCPGVVEGVVRVVKDISETRDLDGEILVTARTDPGWVPLYPMCSGLLIERGSLLSHSAVVARELGLPTIVGISGGLMKRLKTGMRVKMDAGKGKVYILDELEALEKEAANGGGVTTQDTTV
ncbi:pyruvate phosphate dikinase [Dissophora ornata]|nr:pyruvate phosphate dikinase [Dissophora ornata]